MNLQLFAGGEEKTEKATPKKRSEARSQGQVLQSRDLTAAVVLLLILISIRIFAGNIYGEISAFIKRIFTEYANIEDLFTFNLLPRLFMDTVIVLLKTAMPILAVAAISAYIISYAQVGFLFTTATLGVKLDRINPLNGFKRIFSLQGVVELLKSLVKVSIIGYTAYSYLSGEVYNVLNLMDMDVMSIAVYIGSTAINVAIRICVALIFIGIADYGYQWWQYEKNLKMSKHEVKEEFKQAEGNPEVKAKIKQKQRQISMRRMLADVPKADVVITNPTHFAVAIQYDSEVSSAPTVIAKGQDFVAQRIKEVAKENKVEIVENKPLARSLYDAVDIGEAIPPELYQAVAEVLAFVYSLKGKDRAG
ncbi:MAG: flagellar biosynthesis protein FlhB [Clostridia bacterium]|nr:flagellar biosynthesis protein FlhB [Clostridia bacterium]